MALGFLNISHNFAGEANYIIVEWVKSTAQGVPVIGHVTGTGLGGQNDTNATEVNYPSPHVNEQLQITELPQTWFLVRFWRSADGVSKDVLLLILAGNARTGALYPITRLEYVVGRGYSNATPGYNNAIPEVSGGVWADPLQDDQGLRDTRLFEANYWVEERGVGTFLKAEITDRSDVGGGFDFTDAGKFMEDGAVYAVYLLTQIDLPGEDSGSGLSQDEDIYILDTDQNYNAAAMNAKTLIAAFSTTVGTLTFGALSGQPDSRFRLQTHGGSQRNVVLQLDGGDSVRFMGADVNQIILGGSEDIEILIKSGVMYVLARATNHDWLGKVLYAYKQLINSLVADGSLLARANYPRVAALIDSLPASSVVSEVTWQTSSVAADGQTVYANKGKWMNDGTNFRPPDLRNRYLKAVTAVDGSVAFGRYQHQAIAAHAHKIASGTDDGTGPYLSRQHSSGGNLGYAFNGDSGTPTLYATEVVGSTDQDVNNIGLLPLIAI